MLLRNKKIRRYAISLIIIFSTLAAISLYSLDKVIKNTPFTARKKITLDIPKMPNQIIASDSLSWDRENSFINDNIYLYQSGGYEINREESTVSPAKNLNTISKEEVLKPINILIFGDSFLWGHGNPNKYSTIGPMLQDELNKRYPKNIFTVTTLSQPGASTYSYYDFFKINNVEKYKPDIIIYAYYNNDINPAFNESLICGTMSIEQCRKDDNMAQSDPQYQNCLHGSGDIYSRIINKFNRILPNLTATSLIRYCNPIYKKALKNSFNPPEDVKNPAASIYFPRWLEAVKKLKELLSPKEIYLADLYTPITTMKTEKLMQGYFQKNGYKVISMSESERAVFTQRPNNQCNLYIDCGQADREFIDKIRVNPGNAHSSPYLNHYYVKDIVTGIINQIPKERIEELLTSNQEFKIQTERLVTLTMPYHDVKLSGDFNSTRVEFNKNFSPKFNISTPTNSHSPFQYLNCVNLGTSNFALSLNPNIKKGYISITGLPKKETRVAFYYYDKDYLQKIQVIENFKEGNFYPIPESTINVGLYLIFPGYSNGCPTGEEITGPDFTVDVNYKE